MAHLFVEPECPAGRALNVRFGATDVAALPELESQTMARMLFDARCNGDEPAAISRIAERALAVLVPPEAPADVVDTRVTLAIDFLRAQLSRPVTLADVAQAVHLSPGRFRHLFVAETGTTYRSYVLWMRLNASIAAAMAGRSWTEAAHAAGFADSAHLARTFKRMFGLNPATLPRQPPRLQI